jgi:Putative antitoxin of bacterial toxin-antitoxin system, YdaS/YdaT
MDTSTDPKAALNRAIDEAGGKPELLLALKARGHKIRSRNAIGQWLINRVPANYCPDIEELTSVPCEELRPDVAWRVLRNTARRVRARLRELTTTEA